MRILLALLLVPYAAFAFKVEVTPEGSVKQPQQIRAVFSENMTELGNLSAPDPFDLQCSVKGKGRWEDNKTWIYEFEKMLGGGEQCTLGLKAALKSITGTSAEGKTQFGFDTGGPGVSFVRPWQGSTVEEEQAFLLRFDTLVDEASLARSVFFEVEGSAEKIAGERMGEPELKEVLRATQTKMEPGAQFVLVKAARVFPAGKQVALVLAKGLLSKGGRANAEEIRLPFTVRNPFTVQFTCMRENSQAACNPIASTLGLDFNAPIPTSEARKIRLRGENGEWAPEFAKDFKEEEVSSIRFGGVFPAKTKLKVHLPSGLKDTSGRKLVNAGSFPLEVATADYPPLIKFAAGFGIIEAQDAVLPVTLRNVEAKVSAQRFPGNALRIGPDRALEVMDWLGREPIYENGVKVDRAKRGWEARDLSVFSAAEKGKTQRFEIPKPNGAAAFEVVGIPLKEKGFHVIEIESPILGASLIQSKRPMRVQSMALVTDLSAHLKWSEENLLVWVTRLSSGQPVAGAKVRLARKSGGVVLEGVTDKYGLFRGTYKKAPGYGDEIFAFASAGDDFTFVSSAWGDGLEPWRFNLDSYNEKAGGLAHSVLDRTLFRAGETVHFKHFLRKKSLKGIQARGALKTMVIKAATGQLYVLPVKFDANGTAAGEWAIPKNAKLGTYRMYLTAQKVKPTEVKDGEYPDDSFGTWDENTFETANFRVEEFRIPALKGRMELAEEKGEVRANLGVEFTAGGAAKGLEVNTRGRWEASAGQSFADWPDFHFANGGVKEGRTSRNYQEEMVCDEEGECGSYATSDAEGKVSVNQPLPAQKLQLDANGGALVKVGRAPDWDSGALLRLEAEYKDPSGEIMTTSRSRAFFPRGRLIGLKTDGWFAKPEEVRFQIAVTDPNGKPVSGEAVRASWYERTNFSHRKRVLGGFYAYENYDDVKKLGSACEGKTDEKGVLTCKVPAPTTGNVVLAAEMSAGGVKANKEIWVTGSDSWFSQGDSDRIDILPEKKTYQPGETARFQVRLPFRKATVLVAVERQGVVDSFVKELSAENAFVEVPVKAGYAPNMFVSVLVLRGRVGEVKPTALVDLGKPAFKFGVTEVAVGWRAHELKVSVNPLKPEYRVRQKAKARIKVIRGIDNKPAANSEVAVAVVDEALLELRDNSSWKLLEAMMQKHPYLVRTYTSQGQVIGKRHYGLKASPVGGGGGQMTSRELFDTLVYWNPKVKTDGQGEAEIEFPLNDSLTTFRVVAVASEGLDRFGTGQGRVRSFQELMTFAGVAPLAREGDLTHPEITVRNTTAKVMEVEVTATAGESKLTPQKVTLGAGDSRKLSWEFMIPVGRSTLTYQFDLKSGAIGDRIRVSQEVQPPLRETVVQGTLEQVDGKKNFPVQLPANAVRDGSLSVRMDDTLLAGMASVRDYMRLYPFTCLEQQTSRFVALRDRAGWKKLADGMAAYQEGNGLLKYFPEMSRGSVVLTAYVLRIAEEAGYEIPPAVKRSALSALESFLAGRLLPYEGYWSAEYIQWLRVGVMETLTREGRFDAGWLATVSGDISKWPSSALIDWWLIHQRRGEIKDREAVMQRISGILKSRLQWSGTTVGFSNASERGYWAFMESDDLIANRLLLAANEQDSWKSDIGRLARGVMFRRKNGAWDLTTANAWGVLAAEKFAAVHEKEKVAGTTRVALDSTQRSIEWPNGAREAVFPWGKANKEIRVEHQGAGKPWAFVYARAALKLNEPLFRGYRFARSVEAVSQQEKGKWKVGDVYGVRIELEAPADMGWVVVHDPIPAGATILGSGLGGDSALLTNGEKNEDSGWWATHDERKFEGFRRYFEFLPKGKATVEYTVRLNSAGRFSMPNSRVEAMYAPEMYGEAGNAEIVVLP